MKYKIMKYKIKIALIFSGLTINLFLTGCTGGLNYSPPESPGNLDQWQQSPEYGLSASPAEISQWWQIFNDPALNKLVDQGLSFNMDLDQARSRVREARAKRGIETAARFPMLNTSGSAIKTKEGEKQTDELYKTEFDAAWEIDIFGRVSHSIQASSSDMQASIEALRNVQVSLVAEIALNYVEMRSFENRLQLTKDTVEAQQKILKVVMDRFDMQLTDSLAVEQAKFNLAASQAQIPPIQSDLHQALNRLAVLTGKKPGSLNDILGNTFYIPTAPPEIAIGIPADLIRRRPDIRKAEHELAAQSARIGVAKADLYPRFTFNGILQFSAMDASSLFDQMSRLLSIGPKFQWNIFNAGSVRSNIKIQNERQEQALIAYEQAILQALEEAENAIVAYARELDRREALIKTVIAARKSKNIAELLYQNGLKDFIYVLDGQRMLFAAENDLAVSNARVTANLIRLYKALGGGWSPAEPVAVEQ